MPVLALALAAAPRMVLVPIAAGADVPPPSAAAFTNALVGELRRQQPGVEIITQRDVESMLSVERSRAFLGCSSDACMAELGGALGADRLITGDVARLGESYVADVLEYDPAADAWRRRAVMPVGRARFVAGLVGNEVLAVGGDDPRGARVDVYDVAADRWTTRLRPRAAYPHPGWWMAGAVADDRLFVLGGQSGPSLQINAPGRDTASVYDARANRWTGLPPLPWPRFMLGAAVIGAELYVVGGTAGPRPPSGEWEESASVAALPIR